MSIKLTEKEDNQLGAASEPENRATPTPALGLRPMPTALHFRRNHFAAPRDRPAELTVEGLSERTFSASELLEAGPARDVTAVLECAGHRRTELEPPVAGVPWGVGAVSEADWRGLPLRELLLEVGIPSAARAVAFQGRDRGLRDNVGDAVSFSRAIALEKALDDDTLVAWQMNGEAIPAVHGGPLRALVPGHYAVDSVKWLERVTILESDFEGPFQRLDYRLSTDDADAGIELHVLPVHSLLLGSDDGRPVDGGRGELSGIAWGGADGVASVEVSIDAEPWEPAELERASRWGRVFWRLEWHPTPGLHSVAVRATDGVGRRQPGAPQWNRLGYANNSVHRVEIIVA